MIPITSIQNESVKRCMALRDARRRIVAERFLIDGVRELRRALESGIRVVELFVCPSLCRSVEAKILLDEWIPRLERQRLTDREIRIYDVTESIFGRLAFGDRAEGVAAVAVTPDTALNRLNARLATVDVTEPPLFGVMENVEKPGNLGAVLRSADGAGVSGVIACDARRNTVDFFHTATIRTSLGAVFHLPIAGASVTETLSWLRVIPGMQIFCARVDGAIPYTDVDFAGPSAIVLGSEADGLTEAWRGNDVTAVSLPMLGIADSLNVSVAAAILFYEARRQRQCKRDGNMPF